MNTVISRDGTRIAYEKAGRGPALVLVNGAMGHQGFAGFQSLSARLTPHFTVYSYDRRGRGESGDTLPYAVEREVEDIDTLIADAGGSAFLYGHSSGAALALEAAFHLGERVKKLAMYEAPYNTAEEGIQAWGEYIRQLDQLLAAGRQGDAVALFIKLTGASDEQIAEIRRTPVWEQFEAVAPTLAYDHSAILGEDSAVPVERAARVTAPALVMNGSESYPFMYEAAKALARAMPNAQHRILEGQTHEVMDEALAPILVEFFKGNGLAR